MRPWTWAQPCTWGAVAVAVASLTACGTTTPTHYHQLSALTVPLATVSPDGSAELVVDTVRVPEALDRLPFVVRHSATRVQIVDGQRWVSPLPDQLTRTLILDLQAALPSLWVRSRDTPGRTGTRYGLRVEVEQLDMGVDGAVRFIAHWALLDAKDRVLRRDRTAIQVNAGAPGVEALPSAVSEAVARFAAELAQQIPR